MSEFINRVFKVLNDKIERYTRHYGPPKYVKLPRWVYNRLKAYGNILMHTYGEHELETIMGLKPCPTDSIEYLGEIEVF